MRNILLSIVLLSANLFAAEGKTDLSGSNEMQKFYYNLGKEEARKQYYADGYRQAVSDFSVLLDKYKNNIKAYEAGKYLIREAKITYPKVYRMKEKGGTYKIQIDAPTVEKSFTERDLFMLPMLENSPMAYAAGNEGGDETGVFSVDSASDGFSIPERDDVTLNRDGAPEIIKKRVTVHIPYRNDGLKAAIDSFNVPYSATKDGYDLFFTNMEEKIDFCMKITGNPQCKI